MPKRWIVITAGLLGATLLSAQPGKAPLAGFSIGVRPQLIDLTGPAGIRRTFDVWVRNFDQMRPAHVWVWVADALQTPTGAVSFDDSGTYPYSAARWLKLSKDELAIPAGREEKVTVTLSVPSGTRGSGHAVVVVSGAPPKNVPIAPTRENQAFVVARIAFGVIVHYGIPGTGAPDASIETMFLTDNPPPGSGLTKQTAPCKHWLVARVRNTGNVMIYGYGWALLRRTGLGLFERWRLGVKEYGARKVIYPGRSVDMYMGVTRPLPTGDYTAQIRLDYARNRAATAEVPLTVTSDDVKGTFAAQTGPFATQTVGLALTVAQELETLKVAAGGCRTGAIKVTNNEAVPLLVEAEMADVTMDSDGVLLPAAAGPGQPAAAAWLSVAPTQFALDPGKSRRLTYQAALPESVADANDLVGLVRLRARQLDAVQRRTQGDVVGETGVLMVATQAGRGTLQGDVGVLQVDVRPELPGVVRVGIPVRNVGNVHFLPTVSLLLAGQDNPAFQVERTLGKGTGQVLILPGRERMMWFELPANQFQAGQYTATVTLEYGGAQVLRRAFNVMLHGAATDLPKPAGDGGTQPKEPGPAQVGDTGSASAERARLSARPRWDDWCSFAYRSAG